MRQLQLRVPAQRHPLPLRTSQPARRCTRRLPVGAAERGRAPGRPVHAAGVRRGLHRMRAVRRGLSGVGATAAGPQGDQPRRARAAARDRAREHRLLRAAAGERPHARGLRHGARDPVPRPPVRVLGRMRRLRRDTVRQAALAAVRRPADGRQCDGMLLDLRRNQPTTPWTVDADGHGPAWSNSLFEDNAEFGLGLRLAADRHTELARRRLSELREAVGAELVDEILSAPQVQGVGTARPARADRRARASARRAGRSTARRRRPGGAEPTATPWSRICAACSTT